MKKISLLPFLLSTVFAYDNNSGWKLDDDGNVVMKDGNPVYVDTSGREMTVQGSTIASLNAEAKSHREAKEAAEAKLKDYEGLDAKEAREAIQKLKDVDLSKMVNSGELEKVREEVKKQMQAVVDEANKARDEALSQRDQTKIDAFFSGNEFLRDALAVPRDMVESAYRKNFKVQDGELVAIDAKGDRINSKEKVGEYASPDEALRILIEGRSDKDVILKADIGNGTGSSGGGGNRGTGRAMKRTEFDKLPPLKQSEVSAKVRAGEMTLTD